jgi:hypothetical protein
MDDLNGKFLLFNGISADQQWNDLDNGITGLNFWDPAFGDTSLVSAIFGPAGTAYYSAVFPGKAIVGLYPPPVTFEKFLTPAEQSEYIRSANAYTFRNYLISPKTILYDAEAGGEPALYDLVGDAPHTGLASQILTGMVVGQIKPFVASALCDGITGNVAYLAYGSQFCKNANTYVLGSPLLNEYFTSIQAKYIVHDDRSGGGYIFIAGLCPFGSNNTSRYMNSTCTPMYTNSKTIKTATKYELFADILDHPDQWHEVFTSNVNYTTPNYGPAAGPADGYWHDFSTYETTKNLDDISLVLANNPNLYYSGDSIGGTCNVVVLHGPCSTSNGKIVLEFAYKNYNENKHTLGANTNVSYYGTMIGLFDGGQSFMLAPPITTPGPYIAYGTEQEVHDSYIDALDHSPLNLTQTTVQQSNFLTQGQKTIMDFGAHTSLDGWSDYNMKWWGREIGVGTAGGGSNDYGVAITDDSTWRDFRLERSIQQSYYGPPAHPSDVYLGANVAPYGAIPDHMF